MEAIRSSETSVHTRSTWRHVPEDGILHSHRHEHLKSYKETCCNTENEGIWEKLSHSTFRKNLFHIHLEGKKTKYHCRSNRDSHWVPSIKKQMYEGCSNRTNTCLAGLWQCSPEVFCSLVCLPQCSYRQFLTAFTPLIRTIPKCISFAEPSY
jgi:hypothetical protein